MSANKRKILDAARKYAQKGSKDKALKEYERLLKLDPRDSKLRLEVGDVHRRFGMVDEAVAAYTRVADQYAREGFDARAVAVYKQILNLDPDRLSAYEPLSELYQRMGLTAEAVSALQTAADRHHKQGQKREALQLLRRMATLDPSDTTSRLKVAELLRQEGLGEEALVEYGEVADEFESRGEKEEVVAVLEKMLELEPRHLPTLVRLARNLLERKHASRAEPLAKRALEAKPDEPAHFELLAEIYRAQDRGEECIGVYRKLAELYRERGDEDHARDIIQRFVPVEGLAAQSDGRLDAIESGPSLDETILDTPSLDEVWEPGGEPVEAEKTVFAGESFDFGATGQDLGAAAEGSADERKGGPSTVEITRETPRPRAIDGEPDQLLAEASVYLRYGKRDQAVEHLQAILSRAPEHRGALEKLGEALADGGDAAGAVETWTRAAEVARAADDADAFEVLRGRIAGLDPDAAAELKPSASHAGGEPEPAADAGDELDLGAELDLDVDPVDLEPDGDAPDLGAEDEDAPEAETTMAGDAEEEAPTVAGPGASTSTAKQVGDELEEADFYYQQGLMDEAESVYRRILEVAPSHPHALVRLGEIAASRGGDPARAGDASGAEERAPEGGSPGDDTAPQAAAPDVGITEPVDLELGDEGEAPAAAEATPAEAPAAPESAPEAVEPAPEVAPRIEGLDPDDSFDLAAELSDALDDPDATSSGNVAETAEEGFAAVFSEFKKGVSKALGEGDHEARWDLGIAYHEMGLLDDALGEFRAAMGSRARRVDCLHMMGVCAIDLGRPGEAVEHLEAGLADPEIRSEQSLAMRYALGSAHSASGDTEAARDAFRRVAAIDPDFRDVARRLRELEDGRGAGAPDADPSTGEFESFEDVIGEVADEDGDDERPDPERPTQEYRHLGEAAADEDASREEEPEPPEPETRRPRRKKISFV